MHAYVINLAQATERWEFVSDNLRQSEIEFTRVEAVDGRALTLPHPNYSARNFQLRHGHRDNYGHIGCYLSHLKAFRMFLQSSHSHALILEDDTKPAASLRNIIDRAIEYQSTWDILRICGFHDPHPVPFAKLDNEYQLCICLTRLCGTGAYVVTRHAAEVLAKTLDPMKLPIDHAMDREWFFGLRAAAVLPFPVSQRQHRFKTQCAGRPEHKLPWYLRYWTVFPYRTFNETTRVVARSKQLLRARRGAA